jgi:hypothetical protein
LADRVGLTEALSEALAGTRERRSAHDPGRVIRDLAVMLADGGDCVTDMDAYRGQERLFGAKASETTTHRVIKSIDQQLLGSDPRRQGGGTGAGMGRGRTARDDHARHRRDDRDRAFGEGAGDRHLEAELRVSSAELLSG